MSTSTQPSYASVLALSVAPDPQRLPAIRTALRRWLLRQGIHEKRRTIELVTSELLTRAVIHAYSDIVLTVRDDDGVVKVDVTAEMAPEPQRLESVAELTGRRSEALLAALSRDHGSVRDGGFETLWCEVWVHRPPWS